MRYAVEAKRPQFLRNVIARFDDASEQLASYGLSGGIMMDVTDCVRDIPRGAVDDEVRRIALSLYDRVFVTGRGHRPGYGHIMTAGAYARLAWSVDEGEEGALVNVHTSSTIGIFATTRNTLADIHAKWIRSHFEDGLWRLNRTLTEASSSGDPG